MIKYNENTGEPIYIPDEENTQNTQGAQNTQNTYGGPYYDYDVNTNSHAEAPKNPKASGNNGKTKVVKGLKLAGCAVAFGAIAGVTMISVTSIKEHISPSVSERIETTHTDQQQPEATGAEEAQGTEAGSAVVTKDISAVVDQVMPSVVSITSTVNQQNYFGYNTQATGAGSGFIIAKSKDKLMIATNNHVVAGATELKVGFIDGETVDAEIVGTDAGNDLAVISVDMKNVKDKTASMIKVAVLGDSNKLKVGETVIAIGNALGYGQSVTTGVLSAKDREVSMTDGTMNLLQTDAAINPGNSGGVLINQKGEVIGINNAKLADTEVEGMGYAIPMSTAEATLNDIMNVGTIKEGEGAYLGVKGKTIDKTYSSALGIPSGAYIVNVMEGSPAEKAGIHAGDVIVSIDGANINSFEALQSKLRLKKAGTKVTVTLKRANQNGEYEDVDVKVVLGKQSDYVTEKSESEEGAGTPEYGNDQGQQNNQNGYGQENGSGNYADPFEFFFGNGSGSDDFDYFFGR